MERRLRARPTSFRETPPGRSRLAAQHRACLHDSISALLSSDLYDGLCDIAPAVRSHEPSVNHGRRSTAGLSTFVKGWLAQLLEAEEPKSVLSIEIQHAQIVCFVQIVRNDCEMVCVALSG